jgi:hypothetical protein
MIAEPAMHCDAARDRLLTADDPARPDADVAAHLADCPGCRALAAEIAGLEVSVRAYPTPPTVLARRDAFLTKLAPTPHWHLRARHIAAAFAALAAAIVVAVVTVAALRPIPSPNGSNQVVAQADPAVVADLVEWNLKLTETERPAEREKLVRERLPELQTAVQTAALSPDDRAFAEQLLAYGQKLGDATDAVDEAEGFHEMADTLLTRLDATADEPAKAETFAKLYSQVVFRGVDTNLKRAERLELKAEKRARLQELRQAKKKQAAKAEALAKRIPEPAREHVRPKAKSKAQKSASK